MIDIHTHILHAVDDGSVDLATSIQHLKLMQENSVNTIFLTPHFMRQNYDLRQSIIEDRFQELQQEMDKEEIRIKIILGREVYLDRDIPQEIQNISLMMGNSDYLLVETNMTNFPTDLNEILYHLVRMGKKPIMAHPERYTDIINNHSLAEDLLHHNVYLQINAGSLLGSYGKSVQKTAWFLIDNGFAHFVASDNHCNQPEYTLPAAVELIRKNVDDHTAELLTKINPEKVMNNEPITYFYLERVVQENKGFFSRLFKF